MGCLVGAHRPPGGCHWRSWCQRVWRQDRVGGRGLAHEGRRRRRRDKDAAQLPPRPPPLTSCKGERATDAAPADSVDAAGRAGGTGGIAAVALAAIPTSPAPILAFHNGLSGVAAAWAATREVQLPARGPAVEAGWEWRGHASL